MAPAVATWAPGLWRACNALMAAFFALAAVVQVRRAEEGWQRDREAWATSSQGGAELGPTESFQAERTWMNMCS